MVEWLEEEKPVNWARRKGQCDAVAVLRVFKVHFKEVIQEVEVLDDPRWTKGMFTVKHQTSSLAIERLSSHQKGSYEILLYTSGSDVVVVEDRNIPDKFEIKLVWDDQKAVCGFEIDSGPHKLWQISQKVLSNMFFGS